MNTHKDYTIIKLEYEARQTERLYKKLSKISLKVHILGESAPELETHCPFCGCTLTDIEKIIETCELCGEQWDEILKE